MIEKFKQMCDKLDELSDLIKILRLDESYINIVKGIENGEK